MGKELGDEPMGVGVRGAYWRHCQAAEAILGADWLVIAADALSVFHDSGLTGNGIN